MTSLDQIPYTASVNPFDATEFTDNPQQRCPCLLLLDTSGSMEGRPMEQLNEGIRTFKEELMADSLAAKRVEVSILTFGPPRSLGPFQTAETFTPPHLATTGDTPMGAAILQGIAMIEDRKTTYQDHGIPYNRPWVFLITDGAPTDDVTLASRMLREGVERKKFAFFAVGVEGADMATLSRISPRQPQKLQGLKFRELFQWLSNSLGTASRSSPDTERLALPPPSGWTEL
jgi:uncharacterized protein YegL